MNFGGTLRLNKIVCLILVLLSLLIICWRSSGSEPENLNSDIVNVKTLLKAAILAAEIGGKKVVAGKSQNLNIKSKGKTEEGANNPVTDADYASHCVMYYSLKNTFPKVNVISEEHSTNDPSCDQHAILEYNTITDHAAINQMNDQKFYAKDVTIWIDPLDATQEYTEGLYKYVTTMVCIAIRGVPVVGVIHYPFTPLTYWGWLWRGTSSNINNDRSVGDKERNKYHPMVVISRSHAGKVSDIAKEAFGPYTNITQAGGAGYKVMGVVNGDYDLYFHSTAIKKWDLCAGNAIITSLGGYMTTMTGAKIDYSPGTNVKVSDGLLVARFGHEHYLSKMRMQMQKNEQE